MCVAGAAFADDRRGRLGVLIRNAVVVDSSRRAGRGVQIVDQEGVLSVYNGMRIGRVRVERHGVFEGGRSWVQKAANGLHVKTSECTVRRDLLFGEGDVFDAATVVRSNQILSGRSYLSHAFLRVLPDALDAGAVNIDVVTVDSWTIGVEGRVWSGKRAMVDVYDENFAGSGARVGVESNFWYDTWRSGGETVEFESENFAGTFYRARVVVGHDFEVKQFAGEFSRAFIRPGDYEAGVSWGVVDNRRFAAYFSDGGRAIHVRSVQGDAWGGKSWKSGAYVTGHCGFEEYTTRPGDTDARNNPQLHNGQRMLVGGGVYNEKFYSSTMIHGYGHQEYIASGFRAELVGGVAWREFGRYFYAGADVRVGEFGSAGYFFGRLTGGSYFGGGGMRRSVVGGEAFWFSNLWGRGHNRARQFVTLRYTQGWNMGAGVGSLLLFSKKVQPIGMRAYATGRTRLLVNTETVVFTRHEPLGFRLAVFGFADAGTIGMSGNPLRNDFYSSFGLGIRFKNERLVFGALQLRLGVAVGRSGFVRSQVLGMSTERRVEPHRFNPSRPEVAGYE